MTLELGRIMTWRLPAFSALLMFLRASWRTEVRTILNDLAGDSQIANEELRYLSDESNVSLPRLMSMESALFGCSKEGSARSIRWGEAYQECHVPP